MKQRKLDSLGVSAFCESMAMLLQSGIQTDEAISLLQYGHKTGGMLESALKAMQEETEMGSALADAMEKTGVFPDYALKMVRAGERSGRLEDVLFRLAAYYTQQKTILEKLKNAVTYPAAMLVLISAVLLAMLTMVLPVFTGVYDSMTGSLTASSYGYIRWAYGFCYVALFVMVILAGALIGGLFLWNSDRRSVIEQLLNRIPICADLLQSLGLFRFTSALSAFLASGEMQDLAVIQSTEMTDCPAVEAKLRRCIDRMDEGHSISQAAYDEELFEPIYGRMLLAGDRSGHLENVLEKLSGLLEEHCLETVDRLVSIVDPLLSGVLMVTVGLSLISVMLPLIGMMNTIG